VDIRKLLASDPENKQGQKLLQNLEHQKVKLAKTDKRLAKEVSQWVQTVMNDSSVSSRDKTTETKNTIEQAPSERTPPHAPLFGTVIAWLSLLAAVFLAWIVQKSFQG
jgi:hypothetical protein